MCCSALYLACLWYEVSALWPQSSAPRVNMSQWTAMNRIYGFFASKHITQSITSQYKSIRLSFHRNLTMKTSSFLCFYWKVRNVEFWSASVKIKAVVSSSSVVVTMVFVYEASCGRSCMRGRLTTVNFCCVWTRNIDVFDNRARIIMNDVLFGCGLWPFSRPASPNMSPAKQTSIKPAELPLFAQSWNDEKHSFLHYDSERSNATSDAQWHIDMVDLYH